MTAWRGPAFVRSPFAWHLASLVVAGAFILVVGRNQWFWFDEWAFLVPSDENLLLVPHIGHWSTAPRLIYEGLRAAFGLSAYLPYLLLAVLAHLAVCHLVWRVVLRVGADRSLATALVFLLAVLGPGADNVLWAFQVGFMGAIALALAAVLLVDRAVIGTGGSVAIVALSLISITFAGTAIPVLLAAGLVGLVRHGLRRTALLLGPSALVYVVWYLAFARGSEAAAGIQSISDFGVLLPQWMGRYLVDGLDRVTPIPGAGLLIVAAMLIWAVLTYPAWRGPRAMAYALAAAALVQGLLSGLTRVGFGLDQAATGRYVYVLVALGLPAIALALTDVIRERRAVLIPVLGATILLAGYNAALIKYEADKDAVVEQGTRERLAAALDLVVASPSYPDDAVPDPVHAPGVSVANLRDFHERGWFPPTPYGDAALLSVRTYLDVTIVPAAARTCEILLPGGTLDAGRSVSVTPEDATTISIALSDGTAIGDPRPVGLNGPARLQLTGAGSIVVTTDADAAAISVCED